MSKPDLYLESQDIKEIFFVAFASFADVIEPEALAGVTDFMRAMAGSPHRTPAAAQGIRQLADLLDRVEPPAPAPDPRKRFTLVDGGTAA